MLVDPEYPRLGRQVVGEELRPVALRRRPSALEAAGLDLVAEVDLHVDERRTLRPLVADLFYDVGHRPARAALAQRRRREQQHDRLLLVHAREIDLVHVVVGLAGVDRGDVAIHRGNGRRLDVGRRLPDGSSALRVVA